MSCSRTQKAALRSKFKQAGWGDTYLAWMLALLQPGTTHPKLLELLGFRNFKGLA